MGIYCEHFAFLFCAFCWAVLAVCVCIS
jgi:uncharacterized membrane protein